MYINRVKHEIYPAKQVEKYWFSLKCFFLNFIFWQLIKYVRLTLDLYGQHIVCALHLHLTDFNFSKNIIENVLLFIIKQDHFIIFMKHLEDLNQNFSMI
jgi:hypothetical protein